jgi:hypothetical protein
MSTALDFTVDIGSLPTRDQGPLKAKNGMFVNKPQERGFQTPERVKSDQMLAEAPPTSVDNNPILVPSPQKENLLFRPQDVTKPEAPMLFGTEQNPDPSDLQRMRELGMILQAQNDMSGIMSTPLSGIPLLMARDTFDI